MTLIYYTPYESSLSEKMSYACISQYSSIKIHSFLGKLRNKSPPNVVTKLLLMSVETCLGKAIALTMAMRHAMCVMIARYIDRG